LALSKQIREGPLNRRALLLVESPASPSWPEFVVHKMAHSPVGSASSISRLQLFYPLSIAAGSKGSFTADALRHTVCRI
jgi:hypothetical protein